MADARATLLKGLNTDLEGEFQAVIMYRLFASMVQGPYRQELRAFFASEIPEELAHADFAAPIRQALSAQFPEVTERQQRRELASIVSSGAPFTLAEMLERDPGLLGQTRSLWLAADDDVDMFVKGDIRRETSSAERRLSDRKIAWIDGLEARGRVERRFGPSGAGSGRGRAG